VNTKEDMAKYTERRSGGDRLRLERQDDCCQRLCQLKINHWPRANVLYIRTDLTWLLWYEKSMYTVSDKKLIP